MTSLNKTAVVSGPDHWLDRFGRVLIVIVLVLYAIWELLFLLHGSKLPNCYDELGFLFESLRLPAERRLSGYTHDAGLQELIAIMESAWYILERLAGMVHSPEEFVVSVIEHTHQHLVGCRLIVGITALLLFYQIYRLGKHFGGSAVGALASLLTATNLTVVTLGSTCKEDILYWLMLISAFEFCWRTSLTLNRRLAVLTGVAIGAATATKFLGVFAFLLCVVPLPRAQAVDRQKAFCVGVWMGFCGVIATFVFMPFIMTDSAAVFTSIESLHVGTVEGLNRSLAIWSYLWFHLPNLLGWFCIVLGTLEFGIRLLRDLRGPVLLSIVPFGLLVVMGLRPGFSQAYYAMPLALMWMLLTASLVVRITKSNWFGRVSCAAPIIVFSIVALDSAYLPGALKHAALLFSPETRIEARDYLLAHAAPNSCVAITTGVMGDNFYGPPLLPLTAPVTSGGVFRRAQKVIIDRAQGPHFNLRVIEIFEYDPAKVADCEWLVVPSLASSSLFKPEFGTGGSNLTGMAYRENIQAPSGFVKVATFRAVPEWHSLLQPFYSAAEYEKFRHTSFTHIWRSGWYGMTQTIYHNSAVVSDKTG